MLLEGRVSRLPGQCLRDVRELMCHLGSNLARLLAHLEEYLAGLVALLLKEAMGKGKAPEHATASGVDSESASQDQGGNGVPEADLVAAKTLEP